MPTHTWKVIVFVLCAGVLSAAACTLLFFKLGTEPFQDYDESTYAEVVHEAQLNGQSLSFTYAGTNYFRKPPLHFWLIEASEQMLPDVETAARLPSVLAALALIFLVGLLVWEVTRNVPAAFAASLVLFSTSAFVEEVRQVRFDSLVSLFIVLGTYAAVRAAKDERWLLLFGVSIGLGVLAKGLLVGFAIVPLLVILVVYKKWYWFKSPYAWGGATIALLIALPWHIYETLQFGSLFWHEYLGKQVIARVATALFTRQPTNADYLHYLFVWVAPWVQVTLMSVITIPLLWKKLSKEERVGYLSALGVLLMMILVYFGTKTKAFSYLIPLYPFFSVLIGLWVAALLRVRNWAVPILLLFTFFVCAWYGVWLSAYNGWHINPYYNSIETRARDEYQISQLILKYPNLTEYAYETDTLGAIKFYTGRTLIYDTLHPRELPGTGLIITNTNSLPTRTFTSLYIGKEMSLVKF